MKTLDQRLSRQIFKTTKKSWVLRHLAVFCADDLIWLLVGMMLVSVLSARADSTAMLLIFIGTLGISWLVTAGVSRFVNKPRPYESQKYQPIIRPFIETSTFPSSHATFAFALTTFACVMDFSSLFTWFLIVAFAIALGRVAVGVHYLSDVICGALIGTVISAFVLLMQIL